MQVLRSLDDVPDAARGSVLAIGNFDGVHRGHQALIAAARAQAARSAATAAGVLMFEPHPRIFFQPEQAHFELTPLPQKLELLARYGANVSVVLPFDAAFAALSAEAFIDKILVTGLGVSHIIVGYDFHFGRGRVGTPESLVAAGKASGFGVTVLQPVTAGSDVASSSAIRTALSAGNIQTAARLLGHWWRISGTVTGGAKRGTGMGYPTANVTLPSGTNLAHGIYAARVHVNRVSHAGAAYLGTRPTFDNGRPVLETFLLDFDGDLYGQTLEIELIERLRGDQPFVSTAALIAQMDLDVQATRRVLETLVTNDPFAWPSPRN
jgi:riboflavin kinase / FMN adenylyltransferase